MAVVFEFAVSATPSLRGASLAMALAQLITSSSSTAQVLMLTCGALGTDATHGASDASHGGVWGFARVQRLEQPSVCVVSADVSRRANVVAACALLSVSEAEVVCCGGHARRGARLRACGATSARPAAVVRGVYSITGGLGGLGMRAAELLVERGAGPVVLSSRSGHIVLDGRGPSLQLSSEWRMAVRVVASDVGEASEALAWLGSGAPAGVLHAAGVLRDRTLRLARMEELSAVFAPKALAAAHMIAASSCHPLESLLMFSSVSSTVGNVGQAAYAASNAC